MKDATLTFTRDDVDNAMDFGRDIADRFSLMVFCWMGSDNMRKMSERAKKVAELCKKKNEQSKEEP